MLFFIIVQELELREHQTLMIHESARKTDNTRNEAWVNGLWKKFCSKKQLSRD